MKLKNNKTFITLSVTWIFTMAILVIAYITYVAPVQAQVDQKRRALSEQTASMKHATELIGNNGTSSSAKQLEVVDKHFGQFVVSPNIAHDFSLEVSRIAEAIGIKDITTKNNSPGTFEKIPNCKKIVENEIKLSGTGTYSQFARLVNATERCRPIVIVDRFTMDAEEEKDEYCKINITFKILVEDDQSYQQGQMLRQNYNSINESKQVQK